MMRRGFWKQTKEFLTVIERLGQELTLLDLLGLPTDRPTDRPLGHALAWDERFLTF